MAIKPSAKMTHDLILNTPNAKLTEKYTGLLVQFSQWFGKDQVILQIHLAPPVDLRDMNYCIFTFVWELSSKQQSMSSEELTALFAKRAKLQFTYDPPLKPLPGTQPRPNGKFDKFRTILVFDRKKTRSLAAPQPCVREYVEWVD